MKRLRVLVTAGATQVPIDQVRAITNIFKGRTGTLIAQYFANKYHDVTLITSNAELLPNHRRHSIRVVEYRTFDDLIKLMEVEICGSNYDIVIHSAAVSDYRVDGICAMDEDGALVELDKSGKVGSDHEELYVRLMQTPKIIDLIRRPWGFEGLLIKFKLQVGLSDEELLAIARKSRHVSEVDFIVANCLEWFNRRAFIVNSRGRAIEVGRDDLAPELYSQICKKLRAKK
jgi:phosphopantothenate-cysteine ligase/phosphopantothenoylcysteine decarboxylase/phosphopantothenate--cysteine ligase